jgi:hypothetical protein
MISCKKPLITYTAVEKDIPSAEPSTRIIGIPMFLLILSIAFSYGRVADSKIDLSGLKNSIVTVSGVTIVAERAPSKTCLDAFLRAAIVGGFLIPSGPS